MRHIFSDKKTPTDEQIDAVLERMTEVGVDSDEYSKMLTYLERLNTQKAEARRKPVDSNTFVTVAGNLLGILLIVAYEQKHVMTSKGFNFLKQK